MNTPVRELGKFLGVYKTTRTRLKHDELELRKAFFGAESGEAG